MPEQQHPLERRREMLITALRYVEDQHQEISRTTADFVAWANHELAFVETLLRQQRLLELFSAYRLASPRALAAA